MLDETILDEAPSVEPGHDSVPMMSVEHNHRVEQRGRTNRQCEIEDGDDIPPLGKDQEGDRIQPVVKEVCENVEETVTTTDTTNDSE